MKKSEFGQGLTYCLGLFLAHEERYINDKRMYESSGIETHSAVAIWFYGAGDHLFDMVIPDNLSNNLKKRLSKFQNKVLEWRLPMDKKNIATEKNLFWAIEEAKELLRLIDNSMGIKTRKAEWT
jgi:hypothetical protein